MAASSAPQLGDTVSEMLTREYVDEGSSVTLLVGLSNAHEGGVEPLREVVRNAGGEIVRDLGFDIYRVSVPKSSVGRLAEQTMLEYVECPDEERGDASRPVALG